MIADHGAKGNQLRAGTSMAAASLFPTSFFIPMSGFRFLDFVSVPWKQTDDSTIMLIICSDVYLLAAFTGFTDGNAFYL